MLNAIMNLFRRDKTDFAKLVKDGAVILDVRSPSEFQSGHVKGAVNVPVDQLKRHLNQFPDKQKPLITCCASGMRSAAAAETLRAAGYQNVYNGGGWTSLKDKI
jgi:phage shock protein E